MNFHDILSEAVRQDPRFHQSHENLEAVREMGRIKREWIVKNYQFDANPYIRKGAALRAMGYGQQAQRHAEDPKDVIDIKGRTIHE